ncbi:MAG TPA: histidinol-phosphate transaminase [Syntrophomonadaceae bacterium]|nr:histidinol-phosphate transaminase [Syntrophomonadaceae bacterium]HNX29699.1 histidinol-phosphate transaminase [Syntrophomonadaceae bacterium]HPR92961.1 histidinol-phosphate transaminase [Syntrophomonadaceae bacterium]
MDDFIKNKARREIFELKEYVPGKPVEEVERELGISGVIKMASNENPLGASPMAVEAIKANLDRVHYYPDSNCYYLKEKIAASFGIDAASILIGNGSDELLRLIAETFLNRDDEVIIADPTFSEYEFTVSVMGAKCIMVQLKDYSHDLNAILKAVSEKTKIIYLCNPNNPSGTIFEQAAIEAFMQKVPRDILIIFDEAYGEYADKEKFVSGLKYLKQKSNVIILKTFSKIYGLASLRIGYGLTSPEIASAVKRVFEPFNVNMMAQVAALAALDDALHVQKSLQVNSRGKEYLYAAFTAMGLDYVPTQSNFILVDTGRDCREVFESMQQNGVIIRPCDSFGYKNHIRVTIGTDDQNQRFIAALKTVLKG